jgi:hypothetical protein
MDLEVAEVAGKGSNVTDASVMRIPKFVRISPTALEEAAGREEGLITGPGDFIAILKPRYGIVLASWDQGAQLGIVTRFGVVLKVGPEGAVVQWVPVDLRYRPSPSGRRFWTQAKPFFGFAADVAQRYMLASTFGEYFQNLNVLTARSSLRTTTEPRPSGTPTGGYVYLVRSPYGVKIGKSVNVKSRTRLFEVKLPFPITVEHYAWFEDYSFAERDLHRQYHAKRLEGEWFDLSPADIAEIKMLGKRVSVQNL